MISEGNFLLLKEDKRTRVPSDGMWQPPLTSICKARDRYFFFFGLANALSIFKGLVGFRRKKEDYKGNQERMEDRERKWKVMEKVIWASGYLAHRRKHAWLKAIHFTPISCERVVRCRSNLPLC